jgi:DNA/RNA endonuclease YhcR with UshA esterase domain
VVLSRNRDAVEKTFGAGLKSLVGKPVQMSGKIVEYRNRPEIVVSAPEQVVVLEK